MKDRRSVIFLDGEYRTEHSDKNQKIKTYSSSLLYLILFLLLSDLHSSIISSPPSLFVFDSLLESFLSSSVVGLFILLTVSKRSEDMAEKTIRIRLPDR